MLQNAQKLTVIHSVSVWLPLTERWLYDQVRFLPAGFENHVICERTQNLDQIPFQTVHSVEELPRWRYTWDAGMRKLGFRHYLSFLVRKSKEVGARLLHSHFGNTGWQDAGAARRAGMKHVVTFYGLDVSYIPTVFPRWRSRYKELFAGVDNVLCEGPHMAECVVELGCPEHKVRVQRLGIDVENIAFRPRVWDGTGPLRFLIASSFREKKGIPYALEALGVLGQKIPFQVTIIGDASDKPRSRREKERILATIEKHNLGSRIRMLGYQPYSVLLEEAYRHHIFLSPSVTASDGDTEGGAPISIIEMCASGMPVVSTRHCDIPSVIRDGVTGLLADERDVDGLVRNLSWLIEHPALWEKMLLAAREHIKSEFDARVQGEKLAEIYRRLVEDR